MAVEGWSTRKDVEGRIWLRQETDDSWFFWLTNEVTGQRAKCYGEPVWPEPDRPLDTNQLP